MVIAGVYTFRCRAVNFVRRENARPHPRPKGPHMGPRAKEVLWDEKSRLTRRGGADRMNRTKDLRGPADGSGARKVEPD